MKQCSRVSWVLFSNGGSEAFDDRDVGKAAAFAHGLQAVALVLLLQRIHQCRHQFGAGAAKRMAKRDGATVDVETRRVGARRLQRSEERRVGKECVSPCSTRWWPSH